MYPYGNYYHQSSYYGNYDYNNRHQAESSGSSEFNHAISHIKNKDFDRALETVKQMILPLLNNESFDTPAIHLSGSISARASYNSINDRITLNYGKIKKLSNSEKNLHKDLILTLGHELSHAWQWKYAPHAPLHHMEGHATLIESQLAKKVGAQDVFEHILDTYRRHNDIDVRHSYVTMYEYYKDIHQKDGSATANDNIKKASRYNYSAGTSNIQVRDSNDGSQSYSQDNSYSHYHHKKSSSWLRRFFG